jgi:F-type H+-transporting ATPase subunit b
VRIDGFTFVAQILNFLLLVGLLHRFLYRPMLAAVDRREDAIRSHLHDAEREREEARKEAERYKGLQDELEEKRAMLMGEAEKEAGARLEELHKEAHEEVEQVREAWRESLRRQHEDFLELLRARMGRQLFEGMRKALGELADVDLEERVVQVFLNRLEGLAGAEREHLKGALREADGRVRVRSAFPLSEERREEIVAALRPWRAEREVDAHFEVAPELAVGVELLVADRRVAWSAASYLRELEAEAVGLLEAETG